MPDGPIVSVCIANHNGAAHIVPAVRSALRQTLRDIEVLVVDDASSDDSCERVETLARADPRVRLERLAANRGPGGARNRGLEIARGRWFAVLDADDLYHPTRLERLIASAEHVGADAVADDLLVFRDRSPGSARRFLRGRRASAASWIACAEYLESTRMFDSAVNLGFLKPVFAIGFLRRHGLAYDETMRIGEDDDLIVRALAKGMRYRLEPQLTYFYRKHEGSVSHRIGSAHLDRMIERAPLLAAEFVEPGARRAAARRAASFADARAFSEMVAALKARRPARALLEAVRRPAALRHFRMPIAAALSRLAPSRAAAPSPKTRAVVFISRQRIIGRTNGSSAYVLGLAEAVRAAGLEPQLLQPSPHVFGRWPILPLQADMDVFGAVKLRGALRFGRFLVSTQPWRYVAALRAVVGHALERMGVSAGRLAGEKAVYSIAAPWEVNDFLFVARHSPADLAAVTGDYAFMVEALPYTLSPNAPSAIIMHDLFSARAESLDSRAAADDVAVLSRAEEFALLGQADAVVAIQKAEAEVVRNGVPGSRVILAPMAADPVAEAQPGMDDTLLFVGSAAHPNVVGLRWMLEEIWPKIRAARPAAALTVVGNVNRAFVSAPSGVTFTGVVADLASYYRQAGVVVSPLVVGSGLKIKLIEALARGKAIVATSITVQGVEQETAGSLVRTDDATAFADVVSALLGDPAARRDLAARALSTAERHFGRKACHVEFGAWLAQAADKSGGGSQ